MNIQVELYLRDQVVTGQFLVLEGRTLDRFNAPREDSLIVHQATARSLHHPSEERVIGSVRIRKGRILLVVPYDTPADSAARSKLWIERRHVPAELGVGPFVVSGTMHVLTREPVTLEELGRDPDGRTFIPITDAAVQLLYQPGPLLQYPTVFALASSIDTLRLLTGYGRDSTPRAGR